MLTESSYLTAIYTYVGAALAIVLCMAWWLRGHWHPGWIALLVLLGAALLLTPAYPKEGVETLAPALIVAAFSLLTEGFAAAEHALRPLGTLCAAAVGLALLLSLTLFRRRHRQPEQTPPEGAGRTDR